MIEVRGSNGNGYRIFHPWLHRAHGELSALRIPGSTLVRRCILFNALIVFAVVIPYMQELRGRSARVDGWIYLIAFSLLLIELAWKIRYVWLRIRIKRPVLTEIPASSRLRGEHTLFWSAMQTTLFALIHHGHPAHDQLWVWTSLLCTLMLLMPIISSMILRRSRAP